MNKTLEREKCNMVWGEETKSLLIFRKIYFEKNLYLFINFGKEKRVCGGRGKGWGGIYFDVCVEEINASACVCVCVGACVCVIRINISKPFYLLSEIFLNFFI